MKDSKLHVLAIAAHPDDIELSCAGTLILHARKGQATGIVDLTQGELGTRGTAETRLQEAAAAARIMGVSVRENAGMADGFFRNDEEHQRRLIVYIRRFRPEIVLANALTDRHPDHGKGARLIADACFLAGLRRIETEYEGRPQEAWRPKRVYHMIQDRFQEPSFIVDISESMEAKMEAIRCYGSQFHQKDAKEPETYISTQNFLEQVRHRASLLGKRIGRAYGEAFVSEYSTGISDLDALLRPDLA